VPALPSKKHTRAQSKPARRKQQAAPSLRIVDARLAEDQVFVIKGGKHKNSPTREFAKLEFAQDALLKKFGGLPPKHVSGREKPLVKDINKDLADNPEYIYGPVTYETVARAVRALRKANR
jgi:hypothetical protein